MSRRAPAHTWTVGLGTLAGPMGRGGYVVRRRAGRLSRVVEVDEEDVDDTQPSPARSSTSSSSLSDLHSDPSTASPPTSPPPPDAVAAQPSRVFSLDTIGLPQYFSIPAHPSAPPSPPPPSSRPRPRPRYLDPAISSSSPHAFVQTALRVAATTTTMRTMTRTRVWSTDSSYAASDLRVSTSTSRTPLEARHKAQWVDDGPRTPTPCPDADADDIADDVPSLLPDDSPGLSTLSTPALETPFASSIGLLPDALRIHSGPPSPASDATETYHFDGSKRAVSGDMLAAYIPLIPPPRARRRRRSSPHPRAQAHTSLLALVLELALALVRLFYFITFTAVSIILRPPARDRPRKTRTPTLRRRALHDPAAGDLQLAP
ncbi:hypothetical protein Q5752_004940 [Cryptotrichosporon argae]